MGLRITCIVVVLIVPVVLFGQTIHWVQDSISKEPIPYVNILVENQNNGTSANEKGEFSFSKSANGRTVVFSAIGYKPKRIIFYDTISVIYLQSVAIELSEVIIQASKKSKKQQLDRFKKSDIETSFANNQYPWLLAQYFPFSDSLRDTPFLENISIYTESKVANAKFIIKIVQCDSAGVPGALLHHENILATAKKGNHATQVNVSDLMITIPDNGLFIVVECLLIEANKHEFRYTKAGSKETFTKIRYNPSIGGVLVDNFSNTWFYTDRLQWQKFSTKLNVPDTFKVSEKSFNLYHNKMPKLAISITLSD